MFQSIGTTEWLVIILVAAFLLFGGKKIPEFFRGLGESIREFKKASKDDTENVEKKE